MKKVILIVFLFISALHLPLYAYDNEMERTLLRQLSTADNSPDKLDILSQLANVTSSDVEMSTHYTNLLLEEAKKQKNSKYQCIAYLYHVKISFNEYDAKTANQWLALLEPLARKEKEYDILFSGQRAITDLLLLKEQYELATQRANTMLKEATEVGSTNGRIYAYQSLGYVQAYTHKNNKAAESFEKAYALATEINHLVLTLEISDRLIEIYTTTSKDDKRLKYIQEQKRLLLQFLEENPSKKSLYETRMSMINLHFFNYYLDTNQLERAGEYAHLRSNRFPKGYLTLEIQYRKAVFNYLRRTKQYAEAIAGIDTLCNIIESATEISSLQFSKAELLLRIGKEAEALALYKVIWPRKDSLQIAIVNQQSEQLKKSYSADLLQLEQESINRTTQLSLILLIVLISIVLIWFMIHTYRIQGILKRGEKEQRRINNEMAQANASKERFLSNISSIISTPLNSVVKSSLALASNEKFTPEKRLQISQSISETSEELMKLINNILDLSRLEAGMMKFSMEEIEIISTIRSLVTTEIQGKYTISAPQGSLIWIKADSMRLVQVIKTLLDAPRVPHKSISITIEVSRENSSLLHLDIANSHLSDTPTQEIIIYNEINQMILNYFEGQYRIDTEKGIIDFTLPIVNIQRVSS